MPTLADYRHVAHGKVRDLYDYDDSRIPAEVRGRALLVRKLRMVDVECVARGYLTGSGMADYTATGAVCGIELPADLVEAQPSFDKQYVRDWLTSPASGWDRKSDVPPPALPADVVDATRKRYVEAYERLTGRSFADWLA